MSKESRQIAPDIRSGYNATGSTISAYRVVVRNTSNQEGIALPAANTDVTFGVTMHDIANLTRGDIAVGGRVKVCAAAAITDGVAVTMDTAGKVLAWTAGAARAVVGVAQSAASADGDIIEVELAKPGSFGVS